MTTWCSLGDNEDNDNEDNDNEDNDNDNDHDNCNSCLLYTSPSPRDRG